MNVDIQFGVLQLERTGGEGHFRRVEARGVRTLPGAAGSTAVEEIDIRTVAVLVAGIGEIAVFFRSIVETVVLVHYAIDGHIDMLVSEIIALERESGRFGFAAGAGGRTHVPVHVEDRRELELPGSGSGLTQYL